MTIIGIKPRQLWHAGLLAALVLTGSNTTAGAQSGPVAAAPEPAGRQLTLEAATTLALAHNPELKSYAAAAAAATARGEQASRRPNPELGFELENFAGSGDLRGFGAAEYTLMLSQTFELGGKRARAREVIDREVEMIRLDAELTAREIRAQVAKAFMATLAAQTDVGRTVQLAALAVQDLDFVKRRVSQGAISPVETNRARLAASAAEMAAEAARATLQARRLQLAVLWHGEKIDFGEVTGAWGNIAPVPDWTDLSARLAASPQLRRWDVEANRRRAQIASTAAEGKIDLTAAAGIRHFGDGGDNAVVAAISIPLPTSNRNQDATRAAQFGLDRLGAARQAKYVVMLGQLARHYEQLTTSYTQIIAMREDILPLAEQSMSEVDAAYHKGLFSLTDVMATRRTWFEAQGTYFAALASYQEAAVDIDLLLGSIRLDTPISQEND